jgi:Helicase associated domain
MLKNLNFVWDSHEVNWQEKLVALTDYNKVHGDCNVPSNYTDKKLATWVKCQRRQYKLHLNGQASSMTQGRIEQLEKIHFQWEIRTVTTPRKKKNTAATATATATASDSTTAIASRTSKSKVAMRRRSSLLGARHVKVWAQSA